MRHERIVTLRIDRSSPAGASRTGRRGPPRSARSDSSTMSGRRRSPIEPLGAPRACRDCLRSPEWSKRADIFARAWKIRRSRRAGESRAIHAAPRFSASFDVRIRKIVALPNGLNAGSPMQATPGCQGVPKRMPRATARLEHAARITHHASRTTHHASARTRDLRHRRCRPARASRKPAARSACADDAPGGLGSRPIPATVFAAMP